MALITSNMGLKLWNLITDIFSYNDLASNWATLDTHDHSLGKGLQIPTGGLANGAVTATKIAPATITAAQLAPGVGRLQYVTATTSATAQPWQMVAATHGTTITLPSPSSAGAGTLIGVYALGLTSPTSPVTITCAASGAAVFGGLGNVGGSGLQTIAQGNIGVLVFMSNGSSVWQLVSGAFDTGWVALTLGTNVAATNLTLGQYDPPTVRRRNERIYFRGELTNSVAQAASYQWATLPGLIFYPGGSLKLFPIDIGGAFNTLLVDGSDGSVKVGNGGTSAGAVLALDGVSYSAILS